LEDLDLLDDNIKLNLKYTVCEGVGWLSLVGGCCQTLSNTLIRVELIF